MVELKAPVAFPFHADPQELVNGFGGVFFEELEAILFAIGIGDSIEDGSAAF
jgi:hypothetical protein